MNIFPDLRDEKIIAIDVETYDPKLEELGVGAFRAKAMGDEYGYLLGVGISTPGFEYYYSLRHPDSENLPVEMVADYLNRYVLRGSGIKVGANIQYECAWLHTINVYMDGPHRDVQIAEPLIDEERESYALESLGLSYLGKGKDEAALVQWAALNNIPPDQIKANIYRMPAWVAGPYCINDARMCIPILEKQEEEIERQELGNIYKLENELIPIIFEIRKYGIKVDIEAAENLSLKFENEQLIMQEDLNQKAGMEVDIWSVDSVSAMFDKASKEYPRTKKTTKKNPSGSPSFIGKWLQSHTWEPARLVGEIRKIDRLRETYIGNIAKYNINGRVHAQINQLAGDDYGTRTGRMSCSDPNLYQIPKRGPFAKLVRALFLPDEGEEWCSHDYSQQEPRLVVHYANILNLSQASAFAAQFQAPEMDFHNLVLDFINQEGLTRTDCKTISLGSFYAMGKAKIIATLGTSEEKGAEIFKTYHKKLPFVKELEKECTKYAESRGWLKTILGRRRHFDSWEPNLRYPIFFDRKYMGKKKNQIEEMLLEYENTNIVHKELMPNIVNGKPLTDEQVIEEWSGNLKRAYCYKAMNSLIQGSGADMTKQAMVNIYNHFGHVKYMQVQVYDELGGSYAKTKQGREDCAVVASLMCEAVKLTVPLRVDTAKGPNWGFCTKEGEE